MSNLAEALSQELKRNQELLEIYISLGPVGVFGAAFIRQDIADTQKSMASSDIVKMLQAYQKLKENK